MNHWHGLHMSTNFFLICFQGGTHLEFLSLQGLEFSQGLKHWLEQPCHISKRGTTVFDGMLTKELCSWSHFITLLLFFAKKTGTTYSHIEKHSWDLFCDPDTCPLNFSLYWRKTSQPRPDKNKPSPTPLFCGKDELKPKLIYLKNLREKKNRTNFLKVIPLASSVCYSQKSYKENFCWGGKH